jgi:hypothetical protein
MGISAILIVGAAAAALNTSFSPRNVGHKIISYSRRNRCRRRHQMRPSFVRRRAQDRHLAMERLALPDLGDRLAPRIENGPDRSPAAVGLRHARRHTDELVAAEADPRCAAPSSPLRQRSRLRAQKKPGCVGASCRCQDEVGDYSRSLCQGSSVASVMAPECPRRASRKLFGRGRLDCCTTSIGSDMTDLRPAEPTRHDLGMAMLGIAMPAHPAYAN